MSILTLPYRGNIQGLISSGSMAAFITSHSEQQATALYRLDASKEKLSLAADKLPCGATALIANDKTLWFAGEDGKIYQAGLVKGKPKPLATLQFNKKIFDLALLSNNRLAVMQRYQLSIIDIKANTTLQTFAYTEYCSALAASPDGLWLALGDNKGKVYVYQTNEDTQALTLSDETVIHQGAVIALLFERNELRFYSTGADKKLYSTHAQGKLQALDKGRNSNHDANIQSVLLGKERFFTGADDKSIKSWAYAGGQPVTIKEGLVKISHLATLLHQDRPCLIVAGRDASLRLVSLTADEKFQSVSTVIKDGYAWAKHCLMQAIPAEREKGVNFLTDYDDKQSLALISTHFKQEKDNAICEKMVGLVSQSEHADASLLLESMLADKRYETVRLAAFKALVKRADEGDLRPFEVALKTQYIGIGTLALEQLAKRAKQDDRAEALLIDTLTVHQQDLRTLALSLLEKHYDKTSPKASLLALQTRHIDLRISALIRLFQRKLLDNSDVKRAILLAQDHDDEQLRHTAFLIAILSQKNLSQALKTREENFARQLQELEDFDLLAIPKKAVNTKVKAVKPSPINKLTDEDYAVLLQGMTNRHTNVCFNAALGLAVLQDQRAFGFLLMLSQEDNAIFRRGVCYAFGELGQQDAIPSLKLLLNDSDASVRDAAFSALEMLQSAALETAQCGFSSEHENIHRRALKLLLDVIKGTLSKAKQADALVLLKAALNDPFDHLRQETFKACLNRRLGGSEEATLALLLESQYHNVHVEVLSEIMAKSTQLPVIEWVEPFLLGLFDNNFHAIRKSAFEFAIKEKKRFNIERVLKAAVKSEYFNVRQLALIYITKNNSKAKQKFLVELLDDQDEKLRGDAVQQLITSNDKTKIKAALNSQYENVRVYAALAMARWGDNHCYEVLENLLKKEKPEKTQDIAHWVAITQKALMAVGELGDPRAFELVMRVIKPSKTVDKVLSNAAAYALPWVVSLDNREQLKNLQSDERDKVRANAHFALALLGEEGDDTHPLAHRQQMLAHIDAHNVLAATLCFDITPVTLETHLSDSSTCISALLALVSHELLLHGDEPTLSTWALSINNPSLQNFFADLMTQYSDIDARWTYVQQWLIKHHNDEKWTIDVDTLKQIAALLVFADGHTKARLLKVMNHFEKRATKKQWELSYTAFCLRFKRQIKQALNKADKQQSIAVKPHQPMWNQRAFGAYLGLARYEGKSAHASLPHRLRALRSLHRLARQDEYLYSSVIRCLLTLLNHRQVEIRQFAFDDLTVLGMDLVTLGNIATTSPQQDIARQGLQLLMDNGSVKESHKLLQELVESNDPMLSVEAYQLYRDDQGLEKAAAYALKSFNLALRSRCVGELAAHMKEAAIQKLLVKAAMNDSISIAIKAASSLAKAEHQQAFALLQKLLDKNQDQVQQKKLINALRLIKNENVATYLFNYHSSNKLSRQAPRFIYESLDVYRNKALFDGLLARYETHPKEVQSILTSLIKITGYDQPLNDYYEQSDDRSWLDKQYPRKDALLIQLFNRMIKLDNQQMAANLLPAVAWTKSPDAEMALNEAVPVLNTDYLSRAIEALSYRMERREGSAMGLLSLLLHKELDIQFLAAEGLALNGHQQGFAVLLAAIDYQEDDDYRLRAVLALGKTGDERALDKLMNLAKDEGHFLNEVAIEAIGSLAKSDKAQQIFKLLTSSLLKSGYYSDMNIHALNGLRWFNSLEAWQLICEYIEDSHHLWSDREHGVMLLQYWDTDASRDVLLRILKTERDKEVTKTAYDVAQRLWKTPEHTCSVVDYALIQGHFPSIDVKALERVATYASTEDLLALLTETFADQDESDNTLSVIEQSLLKRNDHTVRSLNVALESNATRVINTVARLLARTKTLSKSVKEGLESALSRYMQRWQAQYNQLQGEADDSDSDKIWFKNLSGQQQIDELGASQEALQQLLWSATRHGLINETVNAVLESQHKAYHAFQKTVLKGLLSLDVLPNRTVLVRIEPLLASPATGVSSLANQLIALYGKAEIDWHHLQGQTQLLMSPQFAQPLVEAASQLGAQAQALPVLIAKKDVQTLANIANDLQQQEGVRLGAIEGLACILTTAASDALSHINKNNDDKDISKAAYRAMRRWQRRVEKAANLVASAGAE